MNHLNLFITALNGHLQFNVNNRSFKNEEQLSTSMVHFEQFEKKITEQFNNENVRFICITLCHVNNMFILSSRNLKVFKRFLAKIKEMDTKKPIIILLEHESILDKKFFDLIKNCSQSICHFPLSPEQTTEDHDLRRGSILFFKNVIIEATRRNILDSTQFTLNDVDLLLKAQFS